MSTSSTSAAFVATPAPLFSYFAPTGPAISSSSSASTSAIDSHPAKKAHPSTTSPTSTTSSSNSSSNSSFNSRLSSNSNSASTQTPPTESAISSPNSTSSNQQGLKDSMSEFGTKSHHVHHHHHHQAEGQDELEEERGEGGEEGVDMDHERRLSASAQMDMAGLTVQENGEQKEKEKKMRRASTLSSGSGYGNGNGFSSIHGTGSGNDEAEERETSEVGSGGKGFRSSGRPSRRKAARMGSFEGGGTTGDRDQQRWRNDQRASGEASRTPSSSSQEPSSSSTPSNSFTPSHAPAPPPPIVPHVDIVSYPSADLLRLLACLLEQIAQANDALNQRSASAGASGTNTPAGTTEGRSPSSGGPQAQTDEAEMFERGRFDAAPLNSPVAISRPSRGLSSSGVWGEGSAEYNLQESEVGRERGRSTFVRGPQTQEDFLPFTPGLDLQREVGVGGGVEGFMPSLGGAHSPMPLARRRGNSFLTQRERDQIGTTTAPLMTRAGNLSGNASSATSTVTPPLPTEPPLTSLLTASSLALSSPSASLCFHARNIPAISIEAYLLRILKYCPTTNEVFLSLLVYFDRMARVGLEAQRLGLVNMANGNGGAASGGTRRGHDGDNRPPRLFAIDSFNVHRLVIAGVTVASKFFSDVFYTNSRYAKVGGLPLNELNQLELQFLMLNDFRLVIPLDELQRYADQLILFWVGRNGTMTSSSRPSTPGPSTTPHPHPSTSYFPQTGVHDTATFTSSDNSTRRDADSGPTAASSLSLHRHEDAEGMGGGVPVASQRRPRSIRSQPSSSGTSVTSTITPGTPSTPTPRWEEDAGGVNTSGSNSEVEQSEEEEHRERQSEEVIMDED